MVAFVIGKREKLIADFVQINVAVLLSGAEPDQSFTRHELLNPLRGLVTGVKYRELKRMFDMALSCRELSCYHFGEKSNGEKLYRVRPELYERLQKDLPET